MKSWQSNRANYFYIVIGAVLLTAVIFIAADAFQYRQVKNSLTSYMDNLRDMIFMSTYDSLKKGNMKLFTNHLEEIGTFGDVQEFSLLDKQGVVRYSSDPTLIAKVDSEVLGLDRQMNRINKGYTTYYFPVETLGYCSRCHPVWEVGTINSFYKLTLSRKALDAVKQTSFYSQGFTVIGGGLFLAFIYVLFTLYERKKHEEQLQLSASVFENAVEAIVISNFEGVVERVNPAFSRITGYSEEEIIGEDIHLLDAGEINQKTYLKIREQIQTVGFWSGELWSRNKSGENFPVKISVTAIRNVQNQITHFVHILYDISTEKAAERSLVEMSQIKSEFISSAAHELRTPLSTMLGYVEFLREPEKFGGFTSKQTSGFLDAVYDRGDALNQIINDFLDISRIEHGYSIELNFQEINLPEFLRTTFEAYQIHNSSHALKIKLPAQSDHDLCSVDRHRINQVLENLLSNAVKYSEAGRDILLICSRKAELWEISVVDQGLGMTPEQVERVFDKFYRADSANPAVSGLGLGMSIAKKIIDLHHGTIQITSVQGEGTTATITLPRLSG